MAIEYDAYRVLIAAHIFSVFIFLLAHGAAAMVAFRLRKERRRERVAALLELSAASSQGMGLGFVLILATAFILGYFREWYGATWFWAALVFFIVLSFPMTPMATAHYTTVRRSMGVKGPAGTSKKLREPLPPLSDEELDRELGAVRPWFLLLWGLGGIAVLQWLMMFKPF